MSSSSGGLPAADLSAPATQIVRNRADYLGEGDVGQRIADDKLELFVTTDPAQAMLQQFAQHTPEFIALHDVGGSASLRLLHAIAAALNTKLQHLAIRRQGHGVALATLPFVEIPGHGAQKLRVYSTDVDADSLARRGLAMALLGHSRLAVLMVGELPAHALSTGMQPVHDGIRKGPWPNRQLLMVPLGGAGALAAQAATLAAGTPVKVSVTPQAPRPNDAWAFVTGAWNRLRDPAAAAAPAPSQPAPAEARPVPPRPPAPVPSPAPMRSAAPVPMPPDVSYRSAPMPPDATPRPPVPAAAPAAHATPPAPLMRKPSAPPDHARWAAYLEACSAIKGLVSACVFDFRTLQSLAHLGARPDAEQLVVQGATLFSAMSDSGLALGLGPSQPDATISLTSHHLLLHPLPGHPGIVLHAVLDAAVANLTLTRMQLHRVDTTALGPTGS